MTKDQFNQTTRMQRAVNLHTVPPEKWPAMVQRTVLGLLFIAVGMAGAFLLAWPMTVDLGAILLGATIWSTQMVKGALMALLEPFKAWKRATGGDVDPS